MKLIHLSIRKMSSLIRECDYSYLILLDANMLFYLKHTLYVFKYQYIGLKYQIYNNIADNQDHLST